MISRPYHLTLLGLTLLTSGVSLQAAEADEAKLMFGKDVAPILKQHCFRCHAGPTPKAELDLSRRTSMLVGGQSGPALRLAAAESSLLWAKIAGNHMPPKGPGLNSIEKGIIRTWINQGAMTENEEHLEVADAEGDFADEDYEHWAFHPPRPSTPPTVQATTRVRNPIDAFLLSRLERQGLSFSPAADRVTLIRRLYLDLLGMVPPPDAVQAFLADNRPDSYEQLVDRILASPRYGERWGRHWLDAAGYADSAGVLDADTGRPLMWRYRDYVVQSFNAGKPYDRFLQEQLAGDELYDYWRSFQEDETMPADVAQGLTATGFLRTAPDASRPDFKTIKNVDGLYYYPTIDRQLMVVSSSLMGLTVQCAKCHNHRFDPMAQREYYQLQSILMSAYQLKNWIPYSLRKLPLATKSQQALAQQRGKEVDQQLAALKKAAAELTKQFQKRLFQDRLQKIDERIRADVKTALEVSVAKRNAVQKYLAEKFSADLQPAEKALVGELRKDYPEYAQQTDETNRKLAAQEKRRISFDEVYALYDVAGKPHTPLLRRGDPQNPGPAVDPGVPAMLKTGEPFRWTPPAEKAPTNGRRLAFARWLTQPGHPLTSRVMVNRVWQHLFGQGLVTTAGDFGRSGEEPTHPALLDWLAANFVRQAWDIKQLQRLMVTSSAYRQRSQSDSPLAERAVQRDPGNQLLWRQRLRRLEGEPLRDSLLAVSGQLDESMYGQPVPIQRKEDGEIVQAASAKTQRRSIYLQVRRSQPLTFLQLFDQPVMAPNCTSRPQSTVSLQMLAVMNSQLVESAAEAFAERILQSPGEDPATLACKLAYARLPRAEEQKALSQFLQEQTARYARHYSDRGAWQYGYGQILKQDRLKVEFTHMPHWTGKQWQGGEKLPDPKLGWVFHSATGGHPATKVASVRRWTSSVTGTVRIVGQLTHGAEPGDGIHAVLISSRSGQCGEWEVKTTTRKISVAPLEVQPGDTLDLVVDMRQAIRSDNYDVSYVIELVDKQQQVVRWWDSREGFHGPPGKKVQTASVAKEAGRKALVDLCHMILASNEFSYIE